MSTIERGTVKSAPVSEILLNGSGVIIFIPLLLILVVGLTGLTAFR